MAQTNYTPIKLYYSSVTTNVPLAANLSNGELAINITDGKLFYKDNTGAVKVLADASLATVPVPVASGGTGSITAAGARTNLSAAQSGANTDITSVALTSGTITTPPSAGIDIANKQYVDLLVSTGISIHTPVDVTTTSALTATYADGGTAPTWVTITGNNTLTTGAPHGLSVNDVIVFGANSSGITAGAAYFVKTAGSATITITASYDGPEITTLTNGTGLTITSAANTGVGATLTNSGAFAALIIDGVTVTVGQRVLVRNQATTTQNGVYTVTTAGSGSVNWVLTRATDADQYIPNSTSGLGTGDYFFVTSGGSAGESYVVTSTGTIIFGTTAITFTQFADSTVYSAGTGLTLSGTTFSLSNPVSPTLGGTGVANNAASTITISGAYASTFTLSGVTSVTFPTSGTLATLTGTETFTNKTLTNPTVTNYVETRYAPAAGSAFTVDLTNGTVQQFSLNANGTITLPASVAGKSFVIIVTYSGVYTLSWSGGSTIKWPGGTAPTASSANGKYDIFTFFQDGTNTYGQSFGLNY